jgi:hypothetical protein
VSVAHFPAETATAQMACTSIDSNGARLSMHHPKEHHRAMAMAVGSDPRKPVLVIRGTHFPASDRRAGHRRRRNVLVDIGVIAMALGRTTSN